MLKEITPKELLNKLSKIQLIDIREPYEIKDGNIADLFNSIPELKGLAKALEL